MLEFGQSPAPQRAAAGVDTDGWCSGAAGPSQLLRMRAAWGHAQTLAEVVGGRKTRRIYRHGNAGGFVAMQLN